MLRTSGFALVYFATARNSTLDFDTGSDFSSSSGHHIHFVDLGCGNCGGATSQRKYPGQTLHSCQEICRKSDGCVGIDYDHTNAWCRVRFGGVVSANDNTCNAHCYQVSGPLQFINMGVGNCDGATSQRPYPYIPKLLDCQDICTGTPGCVGIDYDHSNQWCRLRFGGAVSARNNTADAECYAYTSHMVNFNSSTNSELLGSPNPDVRAKFEEFRTPNAPSLNQTLPGQPAPAPPTRPSSTSDDCEDDLPEVKKTVRRHTMIVDADGGIKQK